MALLLISGWPLACGRGGLALIEGDPAGGTGVGGGTTTSAVGVVASTSAATSGAGGAPVEYCYSDNRCTDCISKRCPQAWCDCQTNQDCFGLFSCFDFCDEDEACEQSCLETHEDGISLAILVTGCAGTTCDAKCPFWGNEDFDDCAECAFSSCPAALNTCLADVGCSDLWDCFRDCPPLDLTCHQDCYGAFPDEAAVQKLEDVLKCVDPVCSEQCDE